MAACEKIRTVKLLDRLIAREVLAALALAWLVLVGLDLLMYASGQLLRLERLGLSIASFFEHLAWTVPRRAYELFPSAALVGSVLGLGQLASRSELIAMRAAGASKLRIVGAVLAVLVVLLTVVVAAGETVAVWGERRAQAVLFRASSGGLELVGSGLWAREGRDFLHARAALLEGAEGLRLREVKLLRMDEEARLRELWIAEAASWRNGDWTLHEVRRIVFGEDRLEEVREPIRTWQSDLDPNLLRLGAIRPRYMPISELRVQIEYFKRNELDANEYLAALWGRVVYPLNVLAMCLCALPFAFGSPRGAGFGRNLFFGVVLGIGFWLAQRALLNLAQVYGFDLAVVSVLPALGFGLAGLAWLRRTC